MARNHTSLDRGAKPEVEKMESSKCSNSFTARVKGQLSLDHVFSRRPPSVLSQTWQINMGPQLPKTMRQIRQVIRQTPRLCSTSPGNHGCVVAVSLAIGYAILARVG